MIDRIINTLKELDISTYLVTETVTHSAEAFFVKKRMDLKRRTTLADYTASVYRTMERDGETLVGVCDAPVYPGMDDSELREALSSAYHAASFAGNPRYELLSGRKEDFVPARSGYAEMPLEECMRTTAEAIFAPDVHEDVFVNSVEVFALRKVRRVVNSRGVDVSWESYNVNGEYVIQCVDPSDVETHHIFSLREPDPAALSAEVEASLARTRDRALASRPPKAGSYTVILSEDNVRELLSWYTARSGSGMVYQRYSDWAVGQNVQGEDIRGDRLTVTLKADEPYDSAGIPLKDRPLLENGVLRTVHGGFRFAHYLGIEPTGQYSCTEVPTGSTPLAEMKKKPYLYVVSFSDFQMNSFSGHFGGEIRLAYLYDGETVTPVTGGSINGSILEAQGNMVFSKERYRSARFSGPYAVAIENVAVAGLNG